MLEIMNDVLHQAAELRTKSPESDMPQKIYDRLLENFKTFI